MGSAREAALAALQKWRKNGAWSEDALNAAIRRAKLDTRDAALASRICYGTLQNLRYLDHYIKTYCTTAIGRLEPKVLDILRISAYQLLFLSKIPDHAVLSEAGELCRQSGCERAVSLVNAVLRRIAEQKNDLPPLPGAGTPGWLAMRYSHPLWLVEMLVAAHGYDFTQAFLEANNSETPICVQTNQCKVDASRLYARFRGHGFRPEMHATLPDAILVQGGNLADTLEYKNGWFYVQDAAAKYAVLSADPQPGMTVLDACAAPGGKSFAAAIQMRDQGRILACDIHENKLKRIRDGAARMGFSCIETRELDAREAGNTLNEQFDVVLADVPCSGLGVIRKKPEIRFKQPKELEGLPAIQRAILEGVAPCVKPGGTLLYSTCTILRRENEGVVNGFLTDHPEFTAEDMRTYWPHVDDTDGFFVCKMRKT